MATPRITSVNVGRPRTVEWRGRQVTSAIWKEPVAGPVVLAGVNVHGDDQADRRVHGGPDMAVYAYAAEDYAWWASTVGPLAPGTFGENLTTEGIDVTGAAIGDRWRIGDVVLEVSQPRRPCFKLGIRMGDEDFPGAFDRAGRPGTYLRIVQPGTVAAGDEVTIEPTAAPRIPIGALVSEEPPLDLWETVASDPRVPEGWRQTAARTLARSG